MTEPGGGWGGEQRDILGCLEVVLVLVLVVPILILTQPIWDILILVLILGLVVVSILVLVVVVVAAVLVFVLVLVLLYIHRLGPSLPNSLPIVKVLFKSTNSAQTMVNFHLRLTYKFCKILVDRPPPPHLLGSIEAWLETIFAPFRRFTNLSSCF